MKGLIIAIALLSMTLLAFADLMFDPDGDQLETPGNENPNEHLPSTDDTPTLSVDNYNGGDTPTDYEEYSSTGRFPAKGYPTPNCGGNCYPPNYPPTNPPKYPPTNPPNYPPRTPSHQPPPRCTPKVCGANEIAALVCVPRQSSCPFGTPNFS